jgi:hypothetical protein
MRLSFESAQGYERNRPFVGHGCRKLMNAAASYSQQFKFESGEGDRFLFWLWAISSFSLRHLNPDGSRAVAGDT